MLADRAVTSVDRCSAGVLVFRRRRYCRVDENAGEQNENRKKKSPRRLLHECFHCFKPLLILFFVCMTVCPLSTKRNDKKDGSANDPLSLYYSKSCLSSPFWQIFPPFFAFSTHLLSHFTKEFLIILFTVTIYLFPKPKHTRKSNQIKSRTKESKRPKGKKIKAAGSYPYRFYSLSRRIR